jgi:hypothetical protein
VNRDPKETSHDPLDDWLASARWPEMPADSTQRLRAYWRGLRSPWSVPFAASAAAAVIVLAAAGWLFWRATSTPPVKVNPLASLPVQNVTLPGRAATALELTLMQAHVRKMTRPKTRLAATRSATATRPADPVNQPPVTLPKVTVVSVAPPPAPPRPAPSSPDPITRLLRGNSTDFQSYLQLVADPQTRAEALAVLDRISSPPIERLMQVLAGPRADLRVPAALALGRIDGPATTRRLVEMIDQNQSRREAFIALASSRGREARAYVRRAAESDQYAGLARSALIASEVQ